MPVLVSQLPEQTEPLGPVEQLVMTWHERSKPRNRYFTDRGTVVALDLPRGTTLKDGDVIHNSKEYTIMIKAAAEDILLIKPASAAEMCKVAHHLGNWHRSMEVREDGTMLAEADTPLEEALARLGVSYRRTKLPFEPNLKTSGHD